jgi:hypothetical protein
MRSVRITLLFVAYPLLIGVGAWLLRGEYDRHFMIDGFFHVVNGSDQDRDVALEFPSGAKARFQLLKKGFMDLEVPVTGEGSIGVSVDGKPRDRVGYVTSMNGAVVLVIGAERTTFSQILLTLPRRRVLP